MPRKASKLTTANSTSAELPIPDNASWPTDVANLPLRERAAFLEMGTRRINCYFQHLRSLCAKWGMLNGNEQNPTDVPWLHSATQVLLESLKVGADKLSSELGPQCDDDDKRDDELRAIVLGCIRGMIPMVADPPTRQSLRLLQHAFETRNGGPMQAADTWPVIKVRLEEIVFQLRALKESSDAELDQYVRRYEESLKHPAIYDQAVKLGLVTKSFEAFEKQIQRFRKKERKALNGSPANNSVSNQDI